MADEKLSVFLSVGCLLEHSSFHSTTQSIFFSFNEDIFVQLDVFDEFDRITYT